MFETNKCPKCKYIYEVSWDDADDDEYFTDDEDFVNDSFEKEDLDPCFCPFCGINRVYGSEDDGEDEFN